MIKLFRRGRRKIGLALGSGGAKGLAHIGVLKAFIERKIHIDLIAGSSIGALIGAYYAKHLSIKGLEEVVLGTDKKRLAKLADPNFKFLPKGIIFGSKIKEFLREVIGDIEFKDFKIPFSVVATDANTGEEIVIDNGSVPDAVRASISIPGVFTPVKIRNRFLLDGGIVDPVPVSVVKDMGADFTIACNVIQIPKKDKTLTESAKKSKGVIDPDTPGILDVVIRTIYIMEYEIMKFKIKDADLVIFPDVAKVAIGEFYKGKEAIEEGYRAGMQAFF